jgi:uncharacterized protein (TIGR02453 family)
MIKPATFDFLTALANNNNREWFAQNKPTYETAKADVIDFINLLIPLMAATDQKFSVETEAKKCLMRIYRDVRFSKNKDPYKLNYGIAFDVGGRWETNPSYYLHLQPGNCFFGVGFWMPDAPILKTIREEIDYNGSQFNAIITDEKFTNIFKLSQEDKLKKAPKGYEITHPDIELLKLKSFIAILRLQDDDFLKPTIVNKLKTAFQNIQPFVLFLRQALSK